MHAFATLSRAEKRSLHFAHAGKVSWSKANFLRDHSFDALFENPRLTTRLGSPVILISQWGRTCSLFLSLGGLPQNTQYFVAMRHSGRRCAGGVACLPSVRAPQAPQETSIHGTPKTRPFYELGLIIRFDAA